MKLKKNKKAELTTQQIVILIILITSFVVILFLLFRLNLGKTTEDEICHNSVVMRGGSVLPEGATPLNCQTSYVCLTEDGTCESMTKPEIIKVESKEETYLVLAEEMRDCWWMFGEGKVEYIKKEWTHENYCSICAQLAFDDSMKNIGEFEEGTIDKDDFYNYLTQIEVSNELTYSEYFFGADNIEDLKALAVQEHGVGGTFGKMNLDKQHYLVMGITTEVEGWVLAAGTVGTVIGVFLGGAILGSNPIGWVAGAVIVGGVGAGAGAAAQGIADSVEPEIVAITVEGKGDVENKFMAPTLVELNSDKFKALSCKSIQTLA